MTRQPGPPEHAPASSSPKTPKNPAGNPTSTASENPPKTLGVLIAYYNESGYLEATLDSWVKQSRKPDQMVLVNNNSSDNSEQLARDFMAKHKDIETIFRMEMKPGKVHGVENGLKAVTCDYVAVADADTLYPPHYLELCAQIFRKGGPKTVAAMALPEFESPLSLGARLRRWYFLFVHRLFPKHCYTGGYGQVFHTETLKSVGGFDEKIWANVLMDHEVMYRVHQKGRSRYHIDLWCQSSERRSDRSSVRWNLFERLVYQFTPHMFQGWFFYKFLAPRFRKKGLNHIRLREKPWQDQQQ